MYKRQDQNKFTCFICILDVLYIHTCLYDLYKLSFDYPIHLLKNPSLIKYKFWFLVKMIRHKNSLYCLIFELKFLSHVYISMQNGKTIFGDF